VKPLPGAWREWLIGAGNGAGRTLRYFAQYQVEVKTYAHLGEHIGSIRWLDPAPSTFVELRVLGRADKATSPGRAGTLPKVARRPQLRRAQDAAEQAWLVPAGRQAGWSRQGPLEAIHGSMP